jgi:hypothetical protein
MTKQKPEPVTSALPLADELPSGRPVEPAPGPTSHVCMRCGQPDNAHFGKVVRDRWGWFQHPCCSRWTAIEADRWK